jgi:hypothetical protein
MPKARNKGKQIVGYPLGHFSRYNKYMTCWWNTERPKVFESIPEHVPENFSEHVTKGILSLQKKSKNMKNRKNSKSCERRPAVTKKCSKRHPAV